jgi:hypothetical protein
MNTSVVHRTIVHTNPELDKFRCSHETGFFVADLIPEDKNRTGPDSSVMILLLGIVFDVFSALPALCGLKNIWCVESITITV